MASAQKNLDNFPTRNLNSVEGKRIGIVWAEWNEAVTGAMRDGAVAFLQEYGATAESLLVKAVPGSFELIHGAYLLLEREQVDGVIAIGCVIKGETPHFDFISQAVATGIAQLNLQHRKPVIFGVLTTLNQEQALDRAGGKHGNKGIEAAATLIKMLHF